MGPKFRFGFDADPDPAFYLSADPDPESHKKVEFLVNFPAPGSASRRDKLIEIRFTPQHFSVILISVFSKMFLCHINMFRTCICLFEFQYVFTYHFMTVKIAMLIRNI
jgi:hypothetical protein